MRERMAPRASPSDGEYHMRADGLEDRADGLRDFPADQQHVSG